MHINKIQMYCFFVYKVNNNFYRITFVSLVLTAVFLNDFSLLSLWKNCLSAVEIETRLAIFTKTYVFENCAIWMCLNGFIWMFVFYFFRHFDCHNTRQIWNKIKLNINVVYEYGVLVNNFFFHLIFLRVEGWWGIRKIISETYSTGIHGSR